MNPEIKQQIENLMGGSTLLPASSGATSGSKFDPMRVPSIDKDELLASINSMKGEGQDYSNPEDGLQIPDAGQSPADRLQMILEQTGIRSQEDLLKVEPYLPDLGPGVSINDRLAALPLSAIPVIKKMIFGIGKGVVDDARALVKSRSIPEAVMNASRLYPPTMKARMGMDAITAGIDALRKAEGGEVSQEELMMQAAQGQAGGGEDPNELIRSSIEEMMTQASQAEDPAERDQYLHLAEAAEVGAEAPMAEMAIQLAQAGRGEDTALAHLRPGEVVIPPEAFEDAEFEGMIEKKFRELNIDPARMVVGVGIASLNPITGLEEFGFFKKLAKGVKKVVKKVIIPIAKVAQFIPGPWQPLAALVSKASTVYNVARGRTSPLALLTLNAPAGTSGVLRGAANTATTSGIGGLLSGAKEFFTAGADGVGFLGNTLGSRGIGGLLQGKDMSGGFSVGQLLGGSRLDQLPAAQQQAPAKDMSEEEATQYLSDYVKDNPDESARVQGMILGGMSQAEVAQELFANSSSATGGGTPQWIKSLGDPFGFGGASGLRDAYGGGENSMASVGGLGLAALLGKLAYDEAKNRKGVQLTPEMTMSRYGGYQLAARDAEAAGEAAPDPRDFGMMAGDMPLLSGGRPRPEPAPAPAEMQYGGAVMPMAYAKGGNVATEDFERKNGKINGPGTETSDDIPALLSDGEFVMTGQAVRGAGSFELDSQNGIITLTPNGGEDREKGTELLYEMMELFAEYADKPQVKAKRVRKA